MNEEITIKRLKNECKLMKIIDCIISTILYTVILYSIGVFESVYDISIMKFIIICIAILTMSCLLIWMTNEHEKIYTTSISIVKETMNEE